MNVGMMVPSSTKRLGLLVLLLLACACAADASGDRKTEPSAPPRSTYSESRLPAGSPLAPSQHASSTASTPESTTSTASETTSPPLAHLSPADEARVDAAVQASIKRGEIPGAVVTIVRKKSIVLRRAYGQRSIEPQREAMTVETVFDLASLTKPIVTATAIMWLRERNKLALTDPVARHLPAFARGNKAGVTIEHLLVHSSGLPPANHLKHYRGGRATALRHIYGLPIRSRPGRKLIYSDLGYIVLGELVEQLSGVTLEDFARDKILSPLKMQASGYRPLHGAGQVTAQLVRRTAPTERRAQQWLRGRVHDPRAALLGGVAGHAGLFGNADDLARFAMMMLSGGQLGAKRVLSQESVELLMKPRRVAGKLRTLGYQLREGGVWHTGFTGTSLWIDARHGSAVILLTSRLHPKGKGKVGPLRLALRRIVAQADKSPAGPHPKARVQTGIDVLVSKQFAALKGRRVGLVSHAASRSTDGRSSIELLRRAKGVRLVALFSPEHGIATKQDRAVPDSRHSAGLPIYSLYGASKRPTAKQLRGLDTLVFDLQDVGVRFYTYISTLGYLLEAAAKHHKRVVVLDRPNPIGGLRIDRHLQPPGLPALELFRRQGEDPKSHPGMLRPTELRAPAAVDTRLTGLEP